MATTENSRSPIKTVRRLAWGAVVVALLGLGGVMLWQKLNPQQTESTAVGRPAIGGPFALTDTNGNTVTNETLKGKPFAIFFGFTRCPDICPTTLNDLAQLHAQLGPDADKLNIVFVSVDPEQDRPEDIGQYLTLFDAPIIGLTGTDEQLRQITRAYRVVYEKVPLDETNSDYTIDHTATVFLMDAEGNFVSTLDMHESREVGLTKLQRLVGSTSSR